ncbi:16S rRNA (guanine(966)-N(2))-methyltransferase RsmD [Evansella sp. AB-P1]|uniref:16S rRNA (guanine(966)-N(2))-methyltransferase RsmD n=1 Tax=Evansella sp. AB-P1 TaxID=3037653 RepID=UPI00241EDB9D|nr:16S rRNA (guanine(966)-N(2))-methyltransferase RsmD [Evansella sp. AB-P1]MDG5788312.1 16S rRNA (guanine(966)-N(2))-methyltransferase RsmD [Evansella sp. AB-P1]
MRVISGKRKGLHLKAVPGQSTRPTTDKVKESIFNMVGPYFNGGKMLDLYAGSGSISIEALSRGMEHAILVDRDRKAIETIHMNLKTCKFEDVTEVYRTESTRALKAVQKKDIQFDLIFLDPPYAKQRLDDEIAFIDTNSLLAPSGTIVVEHVVDVNLTNSYTNFEKIKEERYGDTVISIFHYK